MLLEASASYSPSYRGIRTVNTNADPKRKYVEYAGGARELYNLDPDPYELANRYRSASPPDTLAARLHALKTCAAATCRTAEGGQ